MSILLCLGNTGLFHVMSRKEFSECICDLFFYKGYLLVRDCHIILCEAHISCLYSLASVESCEVIIAECSGDLSCPVRTEIKEDNGISILYRCCRSAVFHNYHGHNKLICHIFIIGSLNSLCRGNRFVSLALYKCSVGFLHAIPAVITVHGIVAACNRSNLPYSDLFHFGFQLFHILFSGCRRRITSVKEAVYVYLLDSLSLCQLKKSVNMCIVAVHAAVGHKPHQMKCGIILLNILTCCHKRFILKEIPILNRFCNLGQILINNTSCAHVQMSYLGVSHLAVRKSYCHAAGISSHKRALSHQPVHDRCGCFCHCVAVFVIS